MANRNFPASRVFGFHLMPVRLDCAITIGSSGAVSSISGPGIAAVAKMGTGVYRIQLQDNYNSFLSLNAIMESHNVTGSSIDPNAGVVGSLYVIQTLGNTNWVTAGIPSGITAAVGQVFALAAAPSSGTGRVKLLAPSVIQSIQLAGSPNSGFMSKQPAIPLSGGYVTIVCLGATDASTTTMIPTNPASGDVIRVQMYCNNSSVQ